MLNENGLGLWRTREAKILIDYWSVVLLKRSRRLSLKVFGALHFAVKAMAEDSLREWRAMDIRIISKYKSNSNLLINLCGPLTKAYKSIL